MRNDDLALSLEDFGLSKYEAKAYLALLSRGPLSASELAYYSSLPRTKVYGTLAKLAKKGLVLITKDKPVVCNVIAPEDAFGELVVAQANRVEGMKNLVEKLQKISEEGRKPKEAEERKYLVLAPESVLTVLCELISTARTAIASTLDSWGVRLINQCNDSMLKAITGNIEVKILVSKEFTGNDLLSSVSDSVNIRIGESEANMFVFDKSTVILVNSSDGKGLLFRSADMGNLCSRIFDSKWIHGEDLLKIRFAKKTAQP